MARCFQPLAQPQVGYHPLSDVIQYTCKACCLTLREECVLTVFASRTLSKIFAPMGEKVKQPWQSSTVSCFTICIPHQTALGWSSQGGWDRLGLWHVCGEGRGACTALVAKLGGNSPPQSSWCWWEDNIKSDLRHIWWEGVDWIDPAQIRDKLRVLMNMLTF
jgi:hypothetical protein